jgi:hypothetical protein
LVNGTTHLRHRGTVLWSTAPRTFGYENRA